jgi:hypothetical protein
MFEESSHLKAGTDGKIITEENEVSVVLIITA